jgi:hypothetical protein
MQLRAEVQTLIQEIYRGAASPQRWEGFLRSLREYIDAEWAVLSFVNAARPDARVLVMIGVTREALDRSTHHGASSSPAPPASGRPTWPARWGSTRVGRASGRSTDDSRASFRSWRLRAPMAPTPRCWHG